jgi:4'-phosphopantetheinyl transferase EntD
LLDQKKVSKKNQEIAKAIATDCDRQTKAKMFPRLQHFLTLLFVFVAPISLKKA